METEDEFFSHPFVACEPKYLQPHLIQRTFHLKVDFSLPNGVTKNKYEFCLNQWANQSRTVADRSDFKENVGTDAKGTISGANSDRGSNQTHYSCDSDRVETKAKEILGWINKTVCEEAKCTPPFSLTARTYADFVMHRIWPMWLYAVKKNKYDRS